MKKFSMNYNQQMALCNIIDTYLSIKLRYLKGYTSIDFHDIQDIGSVLTGICRDFFDEIVNDEYYKELGAMKNRLKGNNYA